MSRLSEAMRGRSNSVRKNKDAVCLKKFDIQTVLGEGAFGKVKLAVDKKTKQRYALKFMDKDHIISKNATALVFTERMVLQKLCHPYIVGLRYAFQDLDNLFMVLQLAKGGDLRFHMENSKTAFSKEGCLLYAAEICNAVGYMHTQKIIHRDLKPENILMDDMGHLYLTDFNLAVSVEERIPKSESGTATYMAPEMFLGTGYTYSVDWWAVGVILYECVYFKRPIKYNHDTDVYKVALMNEPIEFPSKGAHGPVEPNENRDSLIKGLLERDVSKRLGSDSDGHGYERTIKTHPYFESVNYEMLVQKKIEPPFKPRTENASDNVPTALIIDDLLEGGSEISQKSKNGPGKVLSRMMSGLFKKKDENAIPKPKTKEEIERQNMLVHFTIFDFEAPLQLPIILPDLTVWPSEPETNIEGSQQKSGLTV
ncbi:kinase-like domain-containing protein [Globomyces pollinis-pini]|nr:kinase-like domain-containing protein [Globomyces pollinis-pini]